MNNAKKIIIAVVSVLAVAGIGTGVYFATSSNETVSENKAESSVTTTTVTTVATTTVTTTTAVRITEIKAEDISVKEDESKKIIAVVNDNANVDGLVFKSLDEKIATVNNKGEVKGIKEGSCEITIMISDGSVSTTIEVKVTNKYGMKKLKESKTVYCTGGNLYEAPGTKYNKIQAVSENTEVTVIAENDGWYECKIGDKHGYIGKTVVQDSPVVYESYDDNDYDYEEDYSSYDDSGDYYEEPEQSYEESGSGSSSSGSDIIDITQLPGYDVGEEWDTSGDPMTEEDWAENDKWAEEHIVG